MGKDLERSLGFKRWQSEEGRCVSVAHCVTASASSGVNVQPCNNRYYFIADMAHLMGVQCINKQSIIVVFSTKIADVLKFGGPRSVYLSSPQQKTVKNRQTMAATLLIALGAWGDQHHRLMTGKMAETASAKFLGSIHINNSKFPPFIKR